MTSRLKRVCVIGAGLAGLACGLAAANHGMSVEVFEDSTQPRTLPAHIQVVPNMLRDLVALGVAEDCIRAGFAYRGIDVIDSRGQLVLQLPTENLAGARFPAALGIQHTDLYKVLERAGQRHGVSIQRNERVVDVSSCGQGARVSLASGQSRDADLVLIATGAGSSLRERVFPHATPPTAIGQAWWYLLIQRPVDLDRPLIGLGDPGRRAVLVPVRHDVAGIALTEPMPRRVESLSIEHIRQSMASFAPRIRGLAAQLTADTPFVLRQAGCGLLEQPWYGGAALAVGDCAHEFAPHFGQAAAQSIEDARVLGELFEIVDHRAELFEQFQRRRLDRVREVFDITSTAARWDLKPHGDADLSHLLARLSRTVAEPA